MTLRDFDDESLRVFTVYTRTHVSTRTGYENLQMWYPRSRIALLPTGRRVVVESIRISNWEWYPACTIFRQLGFVVCRLDWRTDVHLGYVFWNDQKWIGTFATPLILEIRVLVPLNSLNVILSDFTWTLRDFTIWGRVTTSICCTRTVVQIRVQDTRTSRSDIWSPRWSYFPSYFAQDDRQTLFLNIFKICINSCRFM
jgi:hypothetical protein